MINPLAVESSQNMTAVLLLIYIMDYLLVTSHHPVIHQSPGCSNQKLLFATIFVCNYYHDLYKAWSLEVKVPNCTTRSQGFVGLLLQVSRLLLSQTIHNSSFLLRIRKYPLVRNSCWSEIQHCLVWKRRPARVERVVVWIFEQVFKRWHVKISKTHQTPSEIGGIVICPEHTAKPRVKQRF